MRRRSVAGLVTLLFLASARNAAAQSTAEDGPAALGKTIYFGVAGGGSISGAPGVAATGILAIEWRRSVLSAEVGVGETFSGWDRFSAGAQAGVFLLPDANAPYLLAGVEQGTFVDIVNEKRGRTDFALTLEGGYALRQSNGGRQLWFGARGMIPIVSHVYTAAAPQFPVVQFMAKLLL